MSQLLWILDSFNSEMDSILLSAAWVCYLCVSGALILPYFPIRDHWSTTSFIRKINTTIIINNNNKTYFCYLQNFAVLKNFFVAQIFFPKSKNFLPLKLCRLQNFLALCSCICLNTALSVMYLYNLYALCTMYLYALSTMYLYALSVSVQLFSFLFIETICLKVT